MQSFLWTDNTNPACGPSHDHEPIVNLNFKFLHAMAKAAAPPTVSGPGKEAVARDAPLVAS